MSKIAISKGIGAITYYRMGLARVLQQLGHQVSIFDIQSNHPLLDYFAEFEPEKCFFGTWELNDSRPLYKAILARPQMELVAWAPNYGPECKEGDPKDGVLRATEDEIRKVETLVQNNNLRHIFQYYAQSDMDWTHGHWKNLGAEIVGLPMAADIFLYNLVDAQPEWESDLFFCGGRWGFKAINLDRYLFPLLLDENIRFKLYGFGWSNPQCVGPIGDENYRFACASTKIAPCIYEPLIDKGYDCSERIFKVMACGAFTISQRVRTAEQNFFSDNECIYCDSPEDFREKVYHYLKNPDERKPYIDRAVNTVYRNHTYHHRALELAQRFGWIEDILRLEPIIKQLEQVPATRGKS